MKKLLSILLLACTLSSWAQSLDQQVISSAGSFAERANGSLSTTIGEPFIHTFSRSNGILTQGFQQPQFVVTDVSVVARIDIKINVYPNPTTDIIHIQSTEKDLEYRVLDFSGRQIESGLLRENHNVVSLYSMANGVFFLEIFSDTQHKLKTYKITKI